MKKFYTPPRSEIQTLNLRDTLLQTSTKGLEQNNVLDYSDVDNAWS